jgi:hypothetical protein
MTLKLHRVANLVVATLLLNAQIAYPDEKPTPPHTIKSSNGFLQPAPGYLWATAAKSADPKVKWSPGIAHPDYPLVQASSQEGSWHPREGYKFLTDKAGDFSVIPTSIKNVAISPTPLHIIRTTKGRMCPEPGYEWETKEQRVKWVPGKRHPAFANVVAAETSDTWTPMPGFTFSTDRPGDLNTKKGESSVGRELKASDDTLVIVDAQWDGHSLVSSRFNVYLGTPKSIKWSSPNCAKTYGHITKSQFRVLIIANDNVVFSSSSKNGVGGTLSVEIECFEEIVFESGRLVASDYRTHWTYIGEPLPETPSERFVRNGNALAKAVNELTPQERASIAEFAQATKRVVSNMAAAVGEAGRDLESRTTYYYEGTKYVGYSVRGKYSTDYYDKNGKRVRPSSSN